jgi:hypothetical protein
MLRKLIFVVSALALTLTSCGRQVTPDRNTGSSGQFGLPSGYMQIKFNTVGTLDFVNNWYVLAFNTSGTGGEPYALFGNTANNWKDWSLEIVVSQPPGGQVQAVAYQFITQQGTGNIKAPFKLNPTQQQLYVVPNCNNLGTQFCVNVDRHIFSPVTATPTPGASPSGSPSPSASPSGSPSPSPTPIPTPPNGTAPVWYVNWFVASPQGSPQGQVVDAPGQAGINDVSFQYIVDTTRIVDVAPWTYQAGWTAGPSQSATIAGGEILNNP